MVNGTSHCFQREGQLSLDVYHFCFHSLISKSTEEFWNEQVCWWVTNAGAFKGGRRIRWHGTPNQGSRTRKLPCDFVPCVFWSTASHDINAVYSVKNIRVSSIMKLTMWYCVKSHGNYLVLLPWKVDMGLVLWSTQRLSTFMSTQRISRHVDIIFNISTKEQWKNKMSIITWEAEMSYATTFN